MRYMAFFSGEEKRREKGTSLILLLRREKGTSLILLLRSISDVPFVLSRSISDVPFILSGKDQTERDQKQAGSDYRDGHDWTRSACCPGPRLNKNIAFLSE